MMATRGLLMTGILTKGHCTNLRIDCRKQIVTSKIEVHNFNQGERKSSYQLIYDIRKSRGGQNYL